MLTSRRQLLYLTMTFAGLVGTGLAAARGSATLPHGQYAGWVLAGALLLSIWVGWLAISGHIARWNLRNGTEFHMSPSRVPARANHTYAGSGFEWTTLHVEALKHAQRAGLEPSRAVKERFGGNTLIHGLGAPHADHVWISNPTLPHHMIILGTSGKGKTRFLELLDRQRIRQGDVLIVVDPKGDARLIDAVVEEARLVGREKDFRLFAPFWPTQSCAYNPLTHFGDPVEIADRLIGMFPPATGEGAAFQAFQKGASEAVARAIYVAGLPMNLAEVLAGLQDPKKLFFRLIDRTPAFKELKESGLAYAEDRYHAAVHAGRMERQPVIENLLFYVNDDPSHYLKMTSTLVSAVQSLVAGVRKDLLAPDPLKCKKHIIEWSSVVKQKQICYFALGAMAGEDSARSLGKMLLLDFQAFVASRYNNGGAEDTSNPRICLEIDEAHHMLSKPFMTILAEGRGANIAAILSTQTTAQFEEAMGGKAIVRQVLTNTGALVHFQSRDPEEARTFSDLVGKRWLKTFSESHRYEAGFGGAGLKNVADWRAQHSQQAGEQEAPLLPPWVLGQLPKGQALILMSGRILVVKVPLLDAPRSGYVQDVVARGRAA